MAEGVLNGKSADDPFSNFQFQPPRPMGKYRPYARRTRFRAMRMAQPRSSITGSSQDLLEPSKLMALQEDAKSRRISSEVMKSRLYESVIMPASGRRRLNSVSRVAASGEDVVTDEVTRYYMHPTRMAMSVPVTPAASARTTPAGSPTQNRSFLFGLLAPPRSHAEEEDDVADADTPRGLASLFSPQPKYVPAARWTPRVEQEQLDWSPQPLLLQQVPQSRKRSPSPMDDGL